MAWRRAICPTNRSPLPVKATTDGGILLPSALTRTFGSPPSMTATTELVVPRSIPTTRDILRSSLFRFRFRIRPCVLRGFGHHYLGRTHEPVVEQVSLFQLRDHMAWGVGVGGLFHDCLVSRRIKALSLGSDRGDTEALEYLEKLLQGHLYPAPDPLLITFPSSVPQGPLEVVDHGEQRLEQLLIAVADPVGLLLGSPLLVVLQFGGGTQEAVIVFPGLLFGLAQGGLQFRYPLLAAVFLLFLTFVFCVLSRNLSLPLFFLRHHSAPFLYVLKLDSK